MYLYYFKDCRIYVCNSFFARSKDRCLTFDTLEDYHLWAKMNPGSVGKTSFEPVCNKIAYFDKAVLAYRNGKIRLPEVAKWTPEDPKELNMFGAFE